MASEGCNDCPAKELKKFHDAMEKRLLNKLPTEVREPLQEAKHQLLLGLRGFIEYSLREEHKPCDNTIKSRPIGLE